MKTKLSTSALALLTLLTFNLQPLTVHAQGTAFTYQGRLNNGGNAAGGSYDFRFRLAADNQGNTYVGSAVLTNGVPVTNGLFTTTIDFGAGIFSGENYWLEIDVRTNGASGYTTLFPLQAVTPTPYAIYAGTANTVSGTILSSSLPPSANFSGTVTATSLAGNGVNVTNVNATALNGLGAGSFWQLGGNNVSTGQFLGSTNNQPVEVRVNGLRALRVEFGGASSYVFVQTGYTNINGSPNVIGGSPANSIAAGVVGAVIGGGGATNYVNIYGTNSIGALSDFAIIGGGIGNVIQTNANTAIIAGGYTNTIQANASGSVIGGGIFNLIGTNSNNGVIGGGYENIITNATYATVAGGYQNIAGSDEATVGGGLNNVASGPDSMIPGGVYNQATGQNSFAAGNAAHALHDGAFVWSDNSGYGVSSLTNNSVTMRASAGYRFFTGTGGAGAQLLASATSWTTISDRNAKKNFQPVDTEAVLDKLAAIPVQQWNYKWENDKDVPNIGPMAQDFKHAFYPGRDDKGISTLEFDGVELAAIQGLNQKLNEKDAEIEALKAKTGKMDSLEKQLAELELRVKSLAEKK
jgi:Chaperone of endosialidase